MNLNNMDPRLKAKLKIPFNKKEKVNNENIIKIMEENKKEMKFLSDIVKKNELEINNLKKENNNLKNQVHEILGIIQILVNLKD